MLQLFTWLHLGPKEKAVCLTTSSSPLPRETPATYTLDPMQSQLQRYKNRTHFGCYY